MCKYFYIKFIYQSEMILEILWRSSSLESSSKPLSSPISVFSAIDMWDTLLPWNGTKFEHDWPWQLRQIVRHFMPRISRQVYFPVHPSSYSAGNCAENFRWSWNLFVYVGQQAKVRPPPTTAEWSSGPSYSGLDLVVDTPNTMGDSCCAFREASFKFGFERIWKKSQGGLCPSRFHWS